MTIIVSSSTSSRTVQDILDRAGRLINVTPLTDEESADALEALNAMLGDWANDDLMCYAIRDESLTLDGSTSYSIGPSGDLDTDRPDALQGAYVVRSATSYDVTVIDAQQYASVKTKATTSDWPDRVYYEPSMPTGTLYVYPVGTDTSAVLHLLTKTPLTAFATVDGAISLPNGWEKALASNLALEIAPEFNKEPPPSVIAMASNSKRAIRRKNSRPIRAGNELALAFGIRKSNIQTDQ
jgi:hypothetical protein